jgi:RNA polymerase sigma-70 factor (ECF subfamily)
MTDPRNTRTTQLAPGNASGSTALLTKEQHEAVVRNGVIEHHDSLRKFARFLTGNRDQAEDLVQDAIVRAITCAEKFAPGTNFRGWIFTIARNLFYTEKRKSWNKHTPLHEMLHEPATQPTQEKHLEFCEFRRAFWELRGEQRNALMHVGVDGLSYQAAALASACAIGTVKSRVSRARQDLRLLLSESGITSPRPAVRPIIRGRLIEALQRAPRPPVQIGSGTKLSLPPMPPYAMVNGVRPLALVA